MFLLKILVLSCMIILYIAKKKHFCRYCLQAFSTEEILICHLKDCFKINSKQRIIIPKKGECDKFRNYERKIKLPFMIYINFERILVPKNNGKQNPEESYTNKYKKHIACSYSDDYKLVCADDKFSKHFKTLKCCGDVVINIAVNLCKNL